MATEYKLPYTASEVCNKLEQVDSLTKTKQDKFAIGDGLQLVDGVLSLKKEEIVGWEYIGEFSPTSTLTFESDKYKMFWVRAWYTRTAGANNYIRLHIDKDIYLPWTSFNYTQFSVAGLFFRKASLSLQNSSQATYLTNTTRGNGTLEMASANASSLSTGTAFFAGSTEHLIDWKIDLWGMI